LYFSKGHAGEKGLSGERGIPGTLVRKLTRIQHLRVFKDNFQGLELRRKEKDFFFQTSPGFFYTFGRPEYLWCSQIFL